MKKLLMALILVTFPFGSVLAFHAVVTQGSISLLCNDKKTHYEWNSAEFASEAASHPGMAAEDFFSMKCACCGGVNWSQSSRNLPKPRVDSAIDKPKFDPNLGRSRPGRR